MYTIYDSVAEIFNRPFVDHNDASATRAFERSLESNPNKNDYSLYRIGTYDDESGMVTPSMTPVKVRSGFDSKVSKAIADSES